MYKFAGLFYSINLVLNLHSRLPTKISYPPTLFSAFKSSLKYQFLLCLHFSIFFLSFLLLHHQIGYMSHNEWITILWSDYSDKLNHLFKPFGLNQPTRARLKYLGCFSCHSIVLGSFHPLLSAIRSSQITLTPGTCPTLDPPSPKCSHQSTTLTPSYQPSFVQMLQLSTKIQGYNLLPILSGEADKLPRIVIRGI